MPRRTKNAAVVALETQIENHVAGRIRLRRALLGMSQSDLARALGITFQQVQKYERGSNRVSVGKLYRLSEILDVPLTFFFDGLEIAGGPRAVGESAEPGREQAPLLSRRDLDLVRAWRSSPNDVADAVASLLRAITPADEEPATEAKGEAPAPAPAAAPPERRATIGRPPRTAQAAAAAAPAPSGKDEEMEEAGGSESSGGKPPRRRRGAVWDPADMYRAANRAAAGTGRTARR